MREPDYFLEFTRRFEALGFRYMVTGSVATIVYGAPRLTHDVDIVVEIAVEQIDDFASAFPEDEFYFPPHEVIESEIGRGGHVNLIHQPSGFKADLYFAGTDPFHEWALDRAQSHQFENEVLRIAPPEYVIVRKLEYFREGGSDKHLQDIRSILDIRDLNRAELERLICQRGLQRAWARLEC